MTNISKNRGRSWLGCIGRVVSIGLLLCLIFIIGFVLYDYFVPQAGERVVPAGFTRNQSVYISMPDGTQIAAEIWLPATLADGETVPTIIETTRYWRAQDNAILGRTLPILGGAQPLPLFNNSGYAFALVDARGSGASTGSRPIEWSPDEVADMSTVVDWIIAQPWSDGKVGGWGVSYSGNTAELLATTGHPAVRAVAPHYADFEPHLQLAVPGGVFDSGMIHEWGRFTAAMDRNDICDLAEIEGTACTIISSIAVRGVKPVAGAEELLQRAEKDHQANADVFAAVQDTPFRDDEFGTSGLTMGDISPYSYRAEQEANLVPSFFTVGWHDAGTVDGAISRYLTFDTPQHLVIAAVNHGGHRGTDAYLPEDAPDPYSVEQQEQELIDFFDAHIKGEQPIQRQIRYYTMGENRWKTTEVWPPNGIELQHFWFAEEQSLSTTAPASEHRTDEYTVDFSATTGELNRWNTQLGGDPVIYPDRAAEDEKLLTYTTEPLTDATEITGNPIITLHMASTTSDSAFHVYLESVAPDGRVTYITEGILRAIHRHISDAEPPYVQTGPYHSFLRQDALPLVPNEVAEISFQLYATSVMIPQGHRIRVAIAGHDASMFERYPADETPVWTVHRNSAYPSSIQLPIQTR